MRLPPSTRAATPVVSNLLFVAIVVVLAAVVSVFALGVAEDTRDPGPAVSESSGEFAGDRAGSDDQIVRITHVAGDSIPVSELEIAVRACSKTSRLVNLPATRNTPTFIPFADSNLRGELISQGQPGQAWDAGALHEDTGDTFTAGSSFEFRIKNDEDEGGCRLDSGDEVTVRVIHTPTNSIVIKQELTAT
ncbi:MULTISPECIES: type IV pilin [Haloarcula]|uniref:type IV pilin n=1 Tax=Haloarcula TaxID=2237 RepID=UPI0023E83198|nr:type IV pilin [Halomicroarcula sp. SHR3]